MHGVVRSSWLKESRVFRLNVTVPANAAATVYMPARQVDQVKEGGNPVAKVAGVRRLRNENDRVVLEIGSGNYAFEAPRQDRRTGYSPVRNRDRMGLARVVASASCSSAEFFDRTGYEAFRIDSWGSGDKKREHPQFANSNLHQFAWSREGLQRDRLGAAR